MLARQGHKIKMMLFFEHTVFVFLKLWGSSGVNKRVMCILDQATEENNSAAIILSSETRLPISFGSCSNLTADVQLKCWVFLKISHRYLFSHFPSLHLINFLVLFPLHHWRIPAHKPPKRFTLQNSASVLVLEHPANSKHICHTSARCINAVITVSGIVKAVISIKKRRNLCASLRKVCFQGWWKTVSLSLPHLRIVFIKKLDLCKPGLGQGSTSVRYWPNSYTQLMD